MKQQGSHLEPRLHVGCQPPARRHPTGPALPLRLPLQSPLWATASSLHLPLFPSFMPQLPKSHGERRLWYLSKGILTSVPPNSFVTLLKPVCVVWGNSWNRGREKESLEVCILQVGKLRPIPEKKHTQGGDTRKVCHTPSALFPALRLSGLASARTRQPTVSRAVQRKVSAALSGLLAGFLCSPGRS